MTTKGQKEQTWFFPYAKPTATTSILDDKTYFNDNLSPLFQNIHHPYNPQYSDKNIQQVNHNMLHGQPEHTIRNLHTNYTNMNGQLNYQSVGLLASSKQKKANIYWNNNGIEKERTIDYHPYQISSNFRAIPDGHRRFDNPGKMKGNLTQIIPWDMFNKLDEDDDEYFNERDFKKIMNHPFYDKTKQFLEQPFKHL